MHFKLCNIIRPDTKDLNDSVRRFLSADSLSDYELSFDNDISSQKEYYKDYINNNKDRDPKDLLTLEEYLELDGLTYRIDRNGNKEYGVYYNPDFELDYFRVGGAYKDSLLVKTSNLDKVLNEVTGYIVVIENDLKTIGDYTFVDAAPIKYIEWDKMYELSNKKAISDWNDFHISFKEYLKKKNISYEDYIRSNSIYSSYAFLSDETGWIDINQFSEQIDLSSAMGTKKLIEENEIDENDILFVLDCHR